MRISSRSHPEPPPQPRSSLVRKEVHRETRRRCCRLYPRHLEDSGRCAGVLDVVSRCSQESRNDRCSCSSDWSCRLAGVCNRRTNLQLLYPPRHRCRQARSLSTEARQRLPTRFFSFSRAPQSRPIIPQPKLKIIISLSSAIVRSAAPILMLRELGERPRVDGANGQLGKSSPQVWSAEALP
jgi:hypothetical protein